MYTPCDILISEQNLMHYTQIMRRDCQLFSFVVYTFICYNVASIEGRVYCQDSNAKPWTPTGFTCPVVCTSVINAIERLMMLDYKKTIKDQIGSRLKAEHKLKSYESEYANDILINNYGTRRKLVLNKISKQSSNINKISKEDTKNEDSTKHNENTDANVKFKTDTNTDIDNFKIIENIKYAKGILRRSGIVAPSIPEDENEYQNMIEDEKCWFLEKFEPKLLVCKIVKRKCARKSNFDTKFVAMLTKVLNKYVDTIFRFTIEMTEILLENIFGKNTDLRNNIFDVNKLLQYLRQSVDRHRVHSSHAITLTSRHCLTLSMPGCFCKSGYVESSGQCVKPEDCVTNEDYLQYLTRIVVA